MSVCQREAVIYKEEREEEEEESEEKKSLTSQKNLDPKAAS